MDQYDKILEALKGMDDSDLIWAWNDYCDANRYDDQIYPMSSLDDVIGYGHFNGMSASDVIEDVKSNFEDFDTSADYFTVSIYGYESGDSLDDFGSFDIESLADYMYQNDDALGLSEIRDILDEDDEEDEDEDEDEE
jgi:hypothetical protein